MIISTLKRLWQGETGVAALEYALIAALIAVAAAGAMNVLGNEVDTHYTEMESAVREART